MKRAIENLSKKPNLILIDGPFAPEGIKNYKTIIFTSSIGDMSLILDNMNNDASSFIFQSEDNFPVQKGVHIHKTNKSSFIKQYILETNVEPILTNKYD